MISWTISAEPVTSKTASTFSYKSGGLFVGFGFLNADTITSAIGVQNDDTTFRTENWSQTIQHEIGEDATVSGTTIRGTTNSSAQTATFNSAAQTGSTIRQSTILGTQASATSTTSTAQRTSTGSVASTQQFANTTTIQSGEVLTTGITLQTRTYRATVSATYLITTDTTTTQGSHLNSVGQATVYQANTRHASNANVIWVAAQSLISSGIASGAALDYATSTTRTTIYPQTAVVAFSLIDKSLTTTSGHTNSLISQDLEFVQVTNATTQTSFVLVQESIPQLTTNDQTQTVVSEQANRQGTVFSSRSFGAALTTESTQTGQSSQKINDTVLGLNCNRTFSVVASRTVKTENTSWTTSSSSTSSASAPTATYRITESGVPDVTSTATGNPISRQTQEAAGVTMVSTLCGQATTRKGNRVVREVEKYQGVRNPQNGIAAFYGATGLTAFADAYVLASRNVATANPSSFVIYENIGDLEDIDLREIGSAALSILSGSATTTTSAESQTSSSFTFNLVAQGQPSRFRASGYSDLASCCGTLGVSETAYVTIPRGVYKKLDGSTVSKSEQIVSFVSGDGLEYLEPATYFETTNAVSSTAIVWTAPRNSTDLP